MTTDLTNGYLRKSLKVVLPPGEGVASPQVVGTAARNIQMLGFGLSGEVVERLFTYTDDDVLKWYGKTIATLKQMVGDHRDFTPMYPNFPEQVMQASEAELYFNAMANYFGFMLSDMLNRPDLVVLPKFEKKTRPLLQEFHDLRWINLGSEGDLCEVIARLLAANGSLSSDDKALIRWFAATRDIQPLLPETISQKETLAFVVASMSDPTCLLPQIKTATDVLRIAVAMSDGDVSLAEPTKFGRFSKAERRLILGLLESCGATMTEDMRRWKDRWIRLGERLHPGDYKNRFPRAIVAFDVIRNDLPIETFNSKVEGAIKAREGDQLIGMLSSRPGEFARRLDHVIRTQSKPRDVLNAFAEVAPSVSTPVLLQAWRHFNTRDSISSRAFFPKGDAAKVQLAKGTLPPIPEGLAGEAAREIRSVLVARFGKLSPLGNVYISEDLKYQVVPFSQRSASRALRTVSRGSSFELPAGDTIRFYCWWKNIGTRAVAEHDYSERGRVDIDLSVVMYRQNWKMLSNIAYYNLRNDMGHHSGDITSAPDGACEFIDISLPAVCERQARYVVMTVMCYTRQSFTAMPECFAGWMMRQKPNSGEIFEARTVKDKVDITAPTSICVPVIIDAKDRRVYWVDLGLRTAAQIVNAATHSVGMSDIGRAIVDLNKPTLYDLLHMHAEARGTLVDDRTQADHVFGVYQGDVTAFDQDVIMSEYLA